MVDPWATSKVRRNTGDQWRLALWLLKIAAARELHQGFPPAIVAVPHLHDAIIAAELRERQVLKLHVCIALKECVVLLIVVDDDVLQGTAQSQWIMQQERHWHCTPLA